MPVNIETYQKVKQQLDEQHVTLVAVSKLQSPDDIQRMYDLGQRDFGENYVQELVDKQASLPGDIRWHFIGHLQGNKVKYIAPFVHLIHGVDSLKLLKEINKQGVKNNRVIPCLLQVHIAQEETKFGLDAAELEAALETIITHSDDYKNIFVKGLMGMASFTDDTQKVRTEMSSLKSLYDRHASLDAVNCKFSTLSMGMSGDYQLATKLGSNMVRIGSLLFGARPPKTS